MSLRQPASGATGETTSPGAPPSQPIGADSIAPLLGHPYKEARTALLQEFESRYLRDLMARTGGNVSKASREAHVDRSHLIELLQRHKLR